MDGQTDTQMPEIIALLSEKGGSGKTTIATNLAAALHEDQDVLLVDADPQQSALDWSNAYEEGPPAVVVGDGSIEDIPRIATDYDVVIIDGAPRLTNLTRQAAGVADLVLVPVHPSAADIWSSEAIVGVCEDLGTRAVMCLSRAIVGSTLTGSARDALQSFGLPVLDGTCQRVSYVRAFNNGRSVLDTSDEKAAAEIRQLKADILTRTDGQTDRQTDGR
jgi:chromosome partitioning protein